MRRNASIHPFLGACQGAEVASREAGRASVEVEVAAAEEAATASQAKAMRTMRQPCEHPANLWTAFQQVPLSLSASLNLLTHSCPS